MLQSGHFMQEKSFLAWKLPKTARIRTAFSAKQKSSKRSSFKGFHGGAGGIRTHVTFRSNGFQDRLVMTTSIQLRISILFYSQARLQEKRARNATYAIIEKSVNPYCLKVLRWMSRSVIWNISRPPRYDRFDTAPSL